MGQEKVLHLCGGIFFTLVLQARKTPKKNQGECLRDLLGIYDQSAKGISGNSLKTIASRFRNCDPELTSDYIRFGNPAVAEAFRERARESYDEIIDEIKAFCDKYLDLKLHGRWLVRALLELIEKDDLQKDNAKFVVLPECLPLYKSDLKDLKVVNFYNFILGVWVHVCINCQDNGVGQQTYLDMTEDMGESKERKFNSEIGRHSYEDVEVSYDTVLMPEMLPAGRVEQYAAAFTGKKELLTKEGSKTKPVFKEKEADPVMFIETVHYDKARTVDRYTKYLEHAQGKHCQKKTFLYETQRPFYDFYVCNDVKSRIIKSISIPGNMEYERNEPIKDICVEKFPQEHRFIILSGTGGLGKSMMMTHFMLDAIRKHGLNGRIPIFAVLRNYDPSAGDVIDFVFQEFHRHDPELRLPDMIDLLASGRLVLLLDGLDEIKGSNRERFNKEMELLVDNYPESTYIISSRPTMNFRAYSRFMVYDLHPFTQEQSIRMVEKLDENVIDVEIQKDFIEDLKANRFKFNYEERTEFLGNPLFLTIMLLTYEGNHDIPTQKYLFYEQAYDAMAKKHDATKALTREFATGLSSRDFQYYFGEFCAITYEQEKYDFTPEELEDYFREVIDANDLRIRANDFIEDITGKICLMYLDGGKYYFVHRSFQEYFVAYFFSKQLEGNFDAVLEMMLERDETDHDSVVLPMLYGIDPKKTELCIFIPFLKQLFETENPETQYRMFLQRLYPRIGYEHGETDAYFEDASESAIYNFIVELYDLKEYIIGSDLPDDNMNLSGQYVRYDENWDKPGKAEKDVLILEDNLPEGYAEYYKYNTGDDVEIVGWTWEIDVQHTYDSQWQKSTVSMLESFDFPLMKEYLAVQEKYEELKELYKKKPKTSWISKFH